MTIERTLQRLQLAEVRRVPLGELEIDAALQPREDRLVPLREHTRLESRSTQHIGTMRLALEAAQHIELEPLLVAEVERRLFVVDGHHRLRAYRLAGRGMVPIRAISMEHRMAVMVSKLVNCSDRALEMHADQKRDAAWQYLAVITRRGALGLPDGESRRTIAGLFGIGKDTVHTMLRRLPGVNPKGFPAEKCDPGTGFPRWKTVCDWRKQTDDEALGDAPINEEHWTMLEATRIARKLGALETSTTGAAWKLALRMYADEAKLEARNPDTLAFLSDIAEPDDDDY